MKILSLDSIWHNGYFFKSISLEDSVRFKLAFVRDCSIKSIQSEFGSLEGASTMNFTLEGDTIKIGKIHVPYYSYDCDEEHSSLSVERDFTLFELKQNPLCLSEYFGTQTLYVITAVYCKNKGFDCFDVISGDSKKFLPDFKVSEDLLSYLEPCLRESLSKDESAKPFVDLNGVTALLFVSQVLKSMDGNTTPLSIATAHEGAANTEVAAHSVKTSNTFSV